MVNIFKVLFRDEPWFYIETPMSKGEAYATIDTWLGINTSQPFREYAEERKIDIKIIKVEEINL